MKMIKRRRREDTNDRKCSKRNQIKDVLSRD